MTKRNFCDAFDDFAADVLSTAAKHAKTVDFDPFIKLMRASAPIVSAQLKEEIDNVDGDVICRLLTSLEEKMLTLNKQKNGSDVDNPPPQASTQTAAATSEAVDNGEASAFWLGDASATGDSEFCRNDGAENAGKENDGSTGRDSGECDGTDTVEHGQADKK